MGAVDMTTDQEVGQPYKVEGFPTLKFFGFDKKNPQDYSGARDADAIRKFAVDKVSSEVNSRMNKKTKSGSGSGSGKQEQKQQQPADDSAVIVLTDANFD